MEKRSTYNKKLGEQVARDAKESRDAKLHIVSSQSGKWVVVLKGSVRPFKSFDFEKAAISFARRHASAKSAEEVVIHSRDGKIKG